MITAVGVSNQLKQLRRTQVMNTIYTLTSSFFHILISHTVNVLNCTVSLFYCQTVLIIGINR